MCNQTQTHQFRNLVVIFLLYLIIGLRKVLTYVTLTTEYTRTPHYIMIIFLCLYNSKLLSQRCFLGIWGMITNPCMATTNK